MAERAAKARGAVIHELGPRLRQFCPSCRRPAVARFRPFCSRACVDADLGRWLGGGYRIASEEKVEDEDEPS